MFLDEINKYQAYYEVGIEKIRERHYSLHLKTNERLSMKWVNSKRSFGLLFNRYGRLIESYHLLSNSHLEKVTYLYLHGGTPYGCIRFDCNNNLIVSRSKFSYDGKKRATKELIHHLNSGFKEWKVYKYYDDRIVIQQGSNFCNDIMTSTIIVDDQDRLIEEKVEVNGDLYCYKNMYDEQGDFLRQISINEKGNVDWVNYGNELHTGYDSNGGVTCKWETLTEFDYKGNWIRKTRLCNGEPREKRERKIDYTDDF